MRVIVQTWFVVFAWLSQSIEHTPFRRFLVYIVMNQY
jgi:hypothetical protein